MGRRTGARVASSGVLLASFGAKGDGRTDDTAAIQAAINATPSGGTVSGRTGANYIVNGTISFPRDHVTLDLLGATIRTGANRTPGTAAAQSDTLFELGGRAGVRITNGTIGTPLAPFTGSSLAYKIHIPGGSSAGIDHLTADCAGSLLVFVAGSSHQIANNSIANGGISGLGCTNVVVNNNVIVGSPYNALSFAGYSNAPCVGTQCLNNAIWNHGRIAIEDHSPDDPQYNAGSVIRGNHIGPPAANTTSGTAISAVGTGAVIEANVIQEATGYAIEASGLGTQVSGNEISWAAPSIINAPAIVVNYSAPGTRYSAVVEGNTITNAYTGIATCAQPWLAPLTVLRNTIVNPVAVGIALCPPSGSIAAVTCQANTVSFTVRPPSGYRVGIKTTAGAQLADNLVVYTAATYSPGVYDVPLQFVGDDVTLTGNTTNGGGRTDACIFSGSLGGSWSGWRLSGNSFVNGARASLSGLVNPLLSGNVGLS